MPACMKDKLSYPMLSLFFMDIVQGKDMNETKAMSF
jgi:hypothetical protein